MSPLPLPPPPTPALTLAQAVGDIPGIPTPAEAQGYWDVLERIYDKAPWLFVLLAVWTVWRFSPKTFQAIANFVGDMIGAIWEPALSRVGNALDGGRGHELSKGMEKVGTSLDLLAKRQDEHSTVQQAHTAVIANLDSSVKAQTVMLQSVVANMTPAESDTRQTVGGSRP